MNQRIFHCIAALLAWFVVAESAFAGGTWTALTNQPSGGAGTMLLLTDGTVLAQEGGCTTNWNKLTPDSTGSYINGTWSAIAPMGTARLYVASNVMPNGKLFVLGGEYSGPQGAQNITNTGEVYDPVANKWTPITFPQPVFGDDPSILLPNGQILCGYIFSGATYLFNPANNTFTQSGTKVNNDRSDEETWVMLPGGKVLSYSIFDSPDTGPGNAQVYSSGAWSSTGPVPVPLSGGAFGSELGPATLLPNGNVIQIGANSNTAIYSPTSNSWVQGPSLPANTGADDAPGVMCPDGHFMFVVDNSSPQVFTPPASMLDYDYTKNTITDITSTLPASLQSDLSQIPAFITRFLCLPNGHILFNPGTGTMWDYVPSTAPQNSWKPTISGITKANGANTPYVLTGTQLTGLWQGATYGDDAESDSNYPLIRLTDGSGKVHFAKTTNWTPGVATGSTATTVQFTLPVLANGTYQLTVSANGISSSNFKFVLPFSNGPTANYVTASYSSGSKTLTLTGDVSANSVIITQRASVLTVEGSGATKIGTSSSNSQQVSFNLSGDVKVVCNFAQTPNSPGTNDSISLISVNSSNTAITFGGGADMASLTYCTIGTLTINGGANPSSSPDILTEVGTKVTTSNITNVP